MINVTELFDSSRQSILHVINQQLEGKLGVLERIDKDILDCCEL